MNAVVIHAHLYQPPREDPWTGVEPAEPSAAPFHDWNARIAHECYRPLAPHLPWLSFDVGPTLFEWMDREAPALAGAIVDADRASAARLGHGNAMAMPYNHVILPLASRRDKVIEVRWGIRDFERRFGRMPEGMWLPETAVDLETLDVLAEAGIRFTVLAPRQVQAAPLLGHPVVVRTSARRRIAVFVYDGDVAHEVAFGALLRETHEWYDRLALPPDDIGVEELVSLATDGETFGHHHAGGIEALADVLGRLRQRGAPTNFGAFLARHPPREFTRINEGTSWSCVHGLGRWQEDCGCRLVPGTSQAWRGPLRIALNELRGALDAWLAARGLEPPDDPAGARTALPLDWHGRRMFASCGWFFDDIAGIESRICLAQATRAIELAGADGQGWVAAMRARLALASSNEAGAGTGADVLDAILSRRRPMHGSH